MTAVGIRTFRAPAWSDQAVWSGSAAGPGAQGPKVALDFRNAGVKLGVCGVVLPDGVVETAIEVAETAIEVAETAIEVAETAIEVVV